MKKISKGVSLALCALLASQSAVIPASAEAIPSKYDSRDKDLISDVKNQGMVGACWAFGTLGMLETYLKKNEMGDYDFSERHMDMTTAYSYADKVNYDNGFVRNYAYGGNPTNAIAYFYSGKGPVLEKDCKYIPTYEGNYSDAYANTLCDTAGIFVKDVGLVPAVGDMGYCTVSHTDEAVKEMKTHILDNGALAVAYYADGSTDETYYYDGYDTMNHEVLIVGWDDSYPKEKFVSINGNSPTKDGAWIVKNSWGESIGDDGYFYMSYEDNQLYRTPYFYIERVEKTDYDEIYLSCPAAATKYVSSGNNTENTDYSLNVFPTSANSEQSLKEITASFRAGTNYEIYVIADFSEGGDNFGSRVAGGNIDHDCYKTIEFDPVKITGDHYAVCIKYSCEDKSKSLVSVQETEFSAGGELGEDYSGYSFISSDGVNWKDTVKTDSGVVFLRAYTDNDEDTYTVKFSDSKLNYEYASMSKDGRNVYMNPDGSFDVKAGTYDYKVKELGYETAEGQINVTKNTKKSVRLKKAPSLDLLPIELGTKDPGDFELDYFYGLEGESLVNVKDVSIDGKKVAFTQNEDGIVIKRKDLSFLSGKKTAELTVTYSNGAKSSVGMNITKYTDDGKVDIIDGKIKKYIRSRTVKDYKDMSEISTECQKIAENYSKKAMFSLVDAQINKTETGVSYTFGYLITYNSSYKYTFLTGETKLDKTSSKPTLGKASGWDNIIASDELAKSINNGDEITITLGTDKTVPARFWEKVSKSKANITFMIPKTLDMYSHSFTVNCEKLSVNHDIDMTLYSGTKDGKKTYDDSVYVTYSRYIAADIGRYYMDSSFDIKATLTFYIDFVSNSMIYTDYIFKYDNDNVLDISDDYGTVITRLSGKTVIENYDGDMFELCITQNAYVYGDMDLTTEDPDSVDVQYLSTYIASGVPEQIKDASPLLYALMDCDEDGDVDSDDVKALKKYIAELEKKKKEEKAAA